MKPILESLVPVCIFAQQNCTTSTLYVQVSNLYSSTTLDCLLLLYSSSLADAVEGKSKKPMTNNSITLGVKVRQILEGTLFTYLADNYHNSKRHKASALTKVQARSTELVIVKSVSTTIFVVYVATRERKSWFLVKAGFVAPVCLRHRGMPLNVFD